MDFTRRCGDRGTFRLPSAAAAAAGVAGSCARRVTVPPSPAEPRCSLSAGPALAAPPHPAPVANRRRAPAPLLLWLGGRRAANQRAAGYICRCCYRRGRAADQWGGSRKAARGQVCHKRRRRSGGAVGREPGSGPRVPHRLPGGPRLPGSFRRLAQGPTAGENNRQRGHNPSQTPLLSTQNISTTRKWPSSEIRQNKEVSGSQNTQAYPGQLVLGF